MRKGIIFSRENRRLAGALVNKGTWDALTNSPTLGNSGAGGVNGDFYVVGVSGSTTIDGISTWVAGDWIVNNGSVWQKVDNAVVVASVFGRVSAVVATAGDYTASQVTNDSTVSGTYVDDALDTLSSTKLTASLYNNLIADTKEFTGIPLDEAAKFKVDVSYTVESDPNILVSIQFVGANTSFSYYISGVKYTVTNLTPYTNIPVVAAEGTWYVYISSSNVFTVSQVPWTLRAPDVLLWNFYFNNTSKTVTWVGHEKHIAGRDIFIHGRLHAQGAIYGSGMLASAYNGLTATTLASNNDNNISRNQFNLTSGSFWDEDIKNDITHKGTAITAITPATADTDWAGTTYQFLGFTDTNSSTTAGTVTFPSARTLITGQCVTVMQGNTTTIRGSFTVTTGGTGVSFALTTVTGSNAFANNDKVIVGARIPMYYISAVTSGVYTWRKLVATDFLGMNGTATPAAYTTATLPTTQASFNDATVAGGNAGSVITSGRYFPMWLCATNSTSEPIIAVVGQGQSSNATLATALTEAPFQFQNLLGLQYLGIQEICPFYRMTYEYNSGGSFNNNRVRLRAITFLDVRVSTVSGTIISGGTAVLSEEAIESGIDGQGFAIVAGSYIDVPVKWPCIITGRQLVNIRRVGAADQISIDVRKCTSAEYASNPYPVTSIVAAAPITMASAGDYISTDNTLTGWTATLAAGDWLRFYVNSCTDMTECGFILYVNRI